MSPFQFSARETTLNEADKRREDFTEGIGLILNDGGEWFVPRPHVEYYPVFVDGKPAYWGVPGVLTLGVEYERGIEAVNATTDPLERFQEQAYVLGDLYRRNYDIESGELSDLISPVVDEEGQPTEASRALWERIGEVMAWNPSPPRPIIDEASRRLEGWAPGTWVKLGDAQFWSLGSLRLSTLADDHFESLLAIKCCDEFEEQADLLGGVIADVLRSSYRLEDEEIARLIPILRDPITGGIPESSFLAWKALFDFATGDRAERPRTKKRWLQLAVLVATGRDDLDLSAGDASDLASMMVFSERMPPSGQWVDAEIEAIAIERTSNSLNGLI